MNRDELFARLKNDTRVLQDPKVEKAFRAVDRADFISDEYQSEAYEDYAVPIGFGQTISQPTTVAFMLELLNTKVGERILDVGSGSGFTTALLGEMVGKEGRVWGTEIVPELVIEGQKNLEKYNINNNAVILQATKDVGLKQGILYDKILVNASVDEVPKELLRELRIGGIMVIPIGETITRVEKVSETKIKKKEFPGFIFVPLK